MNSATGDVLLIIHDNHQEDNVFPLGAGYLAAMLQQAGVRVDAYCMDVFHYSNNDLIGLLTEKQYDLIGLGFLAGRFMRTVEELCRVVNRHKKGAWLVLGGHGPTAIAEYVLMSTKADVVAMGEADVTIVDLLRCKTGSGRLGQIPGIAYHNGDKIVVNPRRNPVKSLDMLPFPAWDLFPMDRYTTTLKFPGMTEHERAFPVITTRGCVNRCSFCYRMEKGIRTRSPRNIVQEVKILHDTYGIDYVFFSDELSVTSKKQIAELAVLLEQHNLTIKYRMECRVDLFDEEIARILKDSGCVFLNIGFESTDQHVLDQLKKNVTVAQNIQAAEIAIKFGIGVGLNFIWGLPGDSEKSLLDNAAFIKRYNQYDQIRTVRPVTPYPGTPLYYEAIEQGLLKGPADFFDRFKNADLYMVNFMGIPEGEIYQMLFDVNRDLIEDYFRHIGGDMAGAKRLIQKFDGLYFRGDVNFDGPRHYAKRGSELQQ